MGTYRLKSHPEVSIDLPGVIYQDAANMYFLLTGEEKENAERHYTNRAVEQAVLILVQLGVPRETMASYDLMRHSKPYLDQLWLEIALTHARWEAANTSTVPLRHSQEAAARLEKILAEVVMPEVSSKRRSLLGEEDTVVK